MTTFASERSRAVPRGPAVQPEPARVRILPDPVCRAEVIGERLRLTGEFDLSNVAVLRAALEKVSRRMPNGFVVDLAEVTYLDSAGLTLLRGYRRRRPRLLVRSGSIVERVLRIGGFGDDEIVPLECRTASVCRGLRD